jgi:protein PhnA
MVGAPAPGTLIYRPSSDHVRDGGADRRSPGAEGQDMTETKDSNGALLTDGDSVTLIKDLKVKGSSVTLKRGTVVKNIRLTGDPAEIECNAEKVKGLVLRTEFLKKHN